MTSIASEKIEISNTNSDHGTMWQNPIVTSVITYYRGQPVAPNESQLKKVQENARPQMFRA